MRIILFEHPRVPSRVHFNDIANTPLWSCLMTGCAASSLINAGHDATIVDATQTSFENAIGMVLKNPPNILAVHAVYFWEHTGQLFDMLAELRNRGYDGIICIFGFFPTLAWEDLLRQVEAIDCVAVGEPEEILVELCDNIVSSRSVRPSPGIASRFEGKSILPGLRPPIAPLDKLPFPARPYLESEEIVSILASRGCYNGCSFCLVPTLDGGRALWRGRSADNIVAEIEGLVARGKKDFYFVDPNFVGPGADGKENTLRLAHSLSGLGISFGMETRANDIAEPLLQSLCNAGLRRLLLGIESGNSRVLNRFGKRITVAENERAISMIRAVGIEPEIGFIMFDPMSGIEDIGENLAFLKRNSLLDRLGRTVNLLCHEPMIFKGTPGYQFASERNRLAPEGIFGFEGRPLYEDQRVGWLARMMNTICRYILKEMGKRNSKIHWRAEEAGRGSFEAVNHCLVQIFKRMFDCAMHLTSQPKADWTRSQLVYALNEIDDALSGIAGTAS
jgi:anaerobic magnesium-protoporphyrin IX monomethyl ester cyclase